MNLSKCWVDAGLNIPKSAISPDELSKIKDDLSYYLHDYYGGTESKWLYYFREDEETIKVPRNYFVSSLIQDHTDEGAFCNIDVISDFKFRDEIQQRAVGAILNNKYITIKLPPGKGKTVIGTIAIATMKKRALILVDQDSLKLQWEAAFKQFTTIKDDQFGNITSDSIEFKDINIFTIQSFLPKLKKMPDQLNKWMKESRLGIVMFDEVHCLIGPEKFTEVALNCYASKLIGLSATPYIEKQKRKQLLFYWLTQSIFESATYDLKPKIYKSHTCNFEKGNKTRAYVYWSGKLNKARYLKQLAKQDLYIAKLVKMIKQANEKDRKVLILSEHVCLLEALIKVFESENIQVGKFYGNAKKEELANSIIFATYKKCAKGVDIPDADTLILASYVFSHITLEQSVGRILRKHSDKKIPIVVDIVDEAHADLLKAWEVRLMFYRSQEFEIYDSRTQKRI